MSDEKSATPGHEAWIEFLVDHPTRGGLAESLIFMAGYNAGSKASPELLAVLEAICAEAKSWHTMHGHGPDSVQCDSICALIPNMEAAIKAAKG